MNDLIKNAPKALAIIGGVCLAGALYVGSTTHAGGSDPLVTPLATAGIVALLAALLVGLFGDSAAAAIKNRAARPASVPTAPAVEDYDAAVATRQFRHQPPPVYTRPVDLSGVQPEPQPEPEPTAEPRPEREARRADYEAEREARRAE
ncbi:hypothetical protein KIH27_15935, partial [Mycobacterium sp. M1]|nr:hypothetical protein [Mycolicibacter acidiphilus]